MATTVDQPHYVLTPKGIAVVDDLLAGLEMFRARMGDVKPGGLAFEIVMLTEECSSMINDVMEA